MCMPDSPHILEALGLPRAWPWPLYLWWPLFWASLWLSGKESTCQCRRPSSIPGSGRSPGGGNGNPLQYPDLENPMDRGAWGLSPRAHIGLDMTEWPNSCLVCPFSHPALAQNSLSPWNRPPLPVSLQPSQPSSFLQRPHSPLLRHPQRSGVPSYRETLSRRPVLLASLTSVSLTVGRVIAKRKAFNVNMQISLLFGLRQAWWLSEVKGAKQTYWKLALYQLRVSHTSAS